MKSNNNSLGIYKILLVTLVTSLTITGISYIDDKIWNLIMCVIGMLAYSIVGVLFSIGFLNGKKAGKEAYAAIFIILVFLGYGIYCGIKQLQEWVLSWTLTVKIIVPVILVLLIAVIIITICLKNKKHNSVKSNNE